MLFYENAPRFRRVEIFAPDEQADHSFRGYLYRLTYEKREGSVVNSWTVDVRQRGHGNQTHHKKIEKLAAEGLELLKKRKVF